MVSPDCCGNWTDVPSNPWIPGAGHRDGVGQLPSRSWPRDRPGRACCCCTCRRCTRRRPRREPGPPTDERWLRKVRRVTQVPANLQTVSQAVSCSRPAHPGDPRTARADARRWGQFAPSFGRLLRLATHHLRVLAGPQRQAGSSSAAVHHPPPGAPDRGDARPVDPDPVDVPTGRGFPRSRVVTWTGWVTGALGFGSECLQRTVSRYARSTDCPTPVASATEVIAHHG